VKEILNNLPKGKLSS